MVISRATTKIVTKKHIVKEMAKDLNWNTIKYLIPKKEVIKQ